ncbi:hypothetical protein L596_000871 [Steinernema carpocapsae]|uniref:Uncharacterized protein n=1 Tax=Steinernema carpocapsae TaxID=34508 RepID=A0A4U8ULP9_STECR|nr:hypothetical protein L596_000871 [Steinernema carpocapsae]
MRDNQFAQRSTQNGDSSKKYVPTLVLTVDTGAMTSVLSQVMWSRLDPQPGSLAPCSEVCLEANGLPLKILGECSFPVEYEDVRLPMRQTHSGTISSLEAACWMYSGLSSTTGAAASTCHDPRCPSHCAQNIKTRSAVLCEF